MYWFASVGDGQEFVDDRTDRIEVAFDLGEERALAEAEESLRALLARLRPISVALLKPGGGLNAPKTADTLRRGRLEGALMIACHRESIPLKMVTHNAVEKAVGKKPPSPGYPALAAAMLSQEKPKQWGTRGPAFGAAFVVSSATPPS
jgi:hypothetical protein